MIQPKQNKLPFSRKEKILKNKQMNEFKQVLCNSSLTDIDKKNVEYIIEYFQDKHEPDLASRSYLFFGDPGIGKTYLCEKLIAVLDVQVIYMACADIRFKNGIKCRSFKELIARVKNDKKQVIFFDDLSYLFGRDEDSVTMFDQRAFMQILDLVKSNVNKIMVVTMNDYGCLDDRMIDRIEVKADFHLPSNEHKQAFLKKRYGKYLRNYQIKYVSNNTIGYNYRDLPEMIKLAYRLGVNHINLKFLKEAIQLYRPTQLYGFNVQNGIDIGLGDVIGKDKAKSIIERIVKVYRNQAISETLGLRRNNLLLFHGPPGTGKSFMASALAGEIGFPIIRVQARHIHGSNPFVAIERLADMAKRYRNCVIFIDEAEKILGNGRFEEDNPFLAELHRCIDGADGEEIQAIFILAINDLSRFGETLLDRFVLVPFEIPSFEDRTAFFEKKIKSISRGIKLDFPCFYLARVTESMSYRDMDRYWNDLMFFYLENKTGDTEEVIRKVAAQFIRDDKREVMFG